MKIVVNPNQTAGLEKQFLGTSPANLRGREYPREAVASILHSYNSQIGNDENALLQIEALRNGKHCVVTGQQLGMMGGPTYTILKGISCILSARALDAIPVFWLATEDHDIAEINHTYLVDPAGNLEKYQLPLPKDGHFVEDLILDERSQSVLQGFLERVGCSEPLPKTASYSKVMAHFLVKLFARTGMVFLEPHLLRPLARDFFRREIAENQAILSILQATTEAFQASGGNAVIKVDRGTNLFFKTDSGHRRPIRASDGAFNIEARPYSEKELLNLIENEPERFSTNVASRPIMQSLLLPTLAYVGGPTEIAYFHQLKDYHEFYGVPMPWIVPRLSATFITPYAANFLEKCRLDPWYPIPQHWDEVMPELGKGIDAVSKEWQSSLDKHLGKDFGNFISYSITKLQRRVYKHHLSQLKIPPYSLHYLRNFLHPHEELQERILNWWGFQMHTQENIVQALIEQVDWKERGHHYCFL